jgi:hypothetical protein
MIGVYLIITVVSNIILGLKNRSPMNTLLQSVAWFV